VAPLFLVVVGILLEEAMTLGRVVVSSLVPVVVET
jgi:hypothetical protein